MERGVLNEEELWVQQAVEFLKKICSSFQVNTENVAHWLKSYVIRFKFK